jgi:hypothetical protein
MYKQTDQLLSATPSPGEYSKEVQHSEGPQTIDVLAVVKVVEIFAHENPIALCDKRVFATLLRRAGLAAILD